jgi:hypothetical protein
MLGVALGTSDRALTLARLTVMGHERATGLVLLEALAAAALATEGRRLSRRGVTRMLRAE